MGEKLRIYWETKMRKQVLFVILMMFVLISITGCQDKIDLAEEYDEIMDAAEDLVLDHIDAEEMNAVGKVSVKIHTVTEINDEVYMLYTYDYNTTNFKEKFYGVGFCEIRKDDSDYGYELSGSYGGSPGPSSEPISIAASNNKVWGFIQDKRVSRLMVEYSDDKVINYDTEGYNYYIIVRDDTDDLIDYEITAFDENDNVIFRSY